MLLRGGISTSKTVTDVSGRGVGLDVVREAVERLGGEVVCTPHAAGRNDLRARHPAVARRPWRR